MILDSVLHHHLYHCLHPGFGKAFSYLKTLDLSNISPGKYEIDGENVFMIYMEYETRDAADCKMESHKKYIDIQLMIEGAENIGVSIYKDQKPIETYDGAKDAAFYVALPDSTFRLDAGHFAIFYPHDLHQPCISVGEAQRVRKAVFKIAV